MTDVLGPRPRKQLVVAVHTAYVVLLVIGAVWIAVVLGENDPNDDWMISAKAVFWPIAALVLGIAATVAIAALAWLRTGRRAPLFAADMIVPVAAFVVAGPFLLDPTMVGEFPGLAVAVVAGLVSGGTVASAKPPLVTG